MSDGPMPPDQVAEMEQGAKGLAHLLATYFKELVALGFHRHEALQLVQGYQQGQLMLSAGMPDDEAPPPPGA